jgi:hypothetical protein
MLRGLTLAVKSYIRNTHSAPHGDTLTHQPLVRKNIAEIAHFSYNMAIKSPSSEYLFGFVAVHNP